MEPGAGARVFSIGEETSSKEEKMPDDFAIALILAIVILLGVVGELGPRRPRHPCDRP